MLVLSLSQALLLFNEEVKTPHGQKGNTEIRIKRLTTLLNTWTVGSAVVIRLTTHETRDPPVS